jgi:SAM-dependent methyltransferase
MRNINLGKEREFENKKASGANVRIAQSKFYWATALPIERHKEVTFDAIRAKRILEIGCSSGADAVDYCKHAASYIGVDISDVAIDNCNKLSLANATFHCVDGHIIPAEDGSFDYVIVNSLLHHLDLQTSLKEISRVMEKDGALIFREPLGINPLYQLYRALTPMARTIDERPFSIKDLTTMTKFFSLDEDIQYFGFFNLLSAFLRSEQLRSLLTLLDNIISQTPIRLWFWSFSGVARKRRNSG